MAQTITWFQQTRKIIAARKIPNIVDTIIKDFPESHNIVLKCYD